MNKQTERILNHLDCSVHQYRGVYCYWAKKYGVSYNEMLVLYVLREYGFCTQKQVCDRYLVPRQTINNVIARLRNDGLLEVSPSLNIGREKAFVLTKKGSAHFSDFITSMNTVEETAVELLGEDKMLLMTQLIGEYNSILKKSVQQYINKK
ncbi:MAG: winged helix-turn-helix transcriptional regulator [Ruminococcaceae bacterium]|nr:winged helix-turn-helix transcriptional regulator [Oscillospiraceae bacterium]